MKYTVSFHHLNTDSVLIKGVLKIACKERGIAGANYSTG